MRFRRSVIVLALLALVAGGVPATAALTGAVAPPPPPPIPVLKPLVDAAVTAQLAANPTTDVVIGYRAKPTATDVTALRTAGFTGPFMTYEIVPAIAATATRASIKAIANNPRIARVEHDAVLPYTLDRATAVGRAKQVWKAVYNSGGLLNTGGIQGRGVTVAVIDSGIDGRHPDLRDKSLAGPLGENPVTIGNFLVLGRNITNLFGEILVPELFGENAPADAVMAANATAIPTPQSDTGGHGTHVAGIVAGRGTAGGKKYMGVAPAAKLLGLGSGEVLLVSRSLAAMDWLHAHHAEYGVRVVNNSWGGPGAYDPNSLITKAIERLNEDGLVMVFSAGNDGGDGSTIQTSVWANIPSVISVANYYDRTGWLAASSSRGLKAAPETWPLVAAPGTQIISTAMVGGSVTYSGTGADALIAELDGSGEPIVASAPTPFAVTQKQGGKTVVVGDYASMTGTSMAAPFVAGVCALLLEANPSLTSVQIKEILAATANMVPGKSYAADGFAIGRGVVDAAEAVAVALRLRDGATSVADAVATASLDLGANPVEINTSGGPVTDHTIPLLPLLPGLPPITASGHIYHGGILDPFLAGKHRVTTGEPVDFAARTIHSNTPSIALDLTNYRVTFSVVRAWNSALVDGPFDAVNATDDPDFQASFSYIVPRQLSGDYKLVAELHHATNIYKLFELPFEAIRQTMVDVPASVS